MEKNLLSDSLQHCRFQELNHCTQEDFEQLHLLMNVLSRNCLFSPDSLDAVLANPFSHLYVVRCHNRIIACATLCVFYSPTGAKAGVEDVVVHPDYQGCGLGRALMSFVIEMAARWAPLTLQLTSRPSRVAANALYRKLGFKQKETNFYTIRVEKEITD